MIDPSFAQERLAVYHRAMEAKNQGRDRLACSLMHEAVGDMLVLPKASPGREQYWWDTYIAAADEVYSELGRACGGDPVFLEAHGDQLGTKEWIAACEKFFGGESVAWGDCR